MLFNDININTRDILSPFLLTNKYGICDFSFSNIFMWRYCYKATYSLHKGYLVILSSDFDGVPHFFMPLEGEAPEAPLKEVLFDMMAYAKQIELDFRMIGLTDEMVDELKEIMPQNFVIKNADVWDYLYLSTDLISLTGKKFHAKRNHINKFNSLYEYEYINLDGSHIDICLAMLDEWEKENDETESLLAEKIAVKEALINFDQLQLRGGGLLINGTLRAFTLGQPLNDDVFVIHVEKADYSYEGIYSKINQLFAENTCSGFKYINREEDMGIPGLRKAKMSYNPSLLLNKHIGILE